MKWILGLLTGGNPLVLAIIAAVLIGIGTAGGVKVTQWWAAGKIAAADRNTAKAEKALDDYQKQAAAAVTQQLLEQAAQAAKAQRRTDQIAVEYERKRRANETALASAQADTAALRRRFAGVGLPDGPAKDDGSPVPSPTDPAGQPYAGACTERPGAIIDAVESLDRDAKACQDTAEQLIGLQAWVRDVCAAPPSPK